MRVHTMEFGATDACSPMFRKWNSLKTLLFIASFLLWGIISVHAQPVESEVHVDGVNRRVSLFLPSGYDSSVAFPMVIALHPLNTSRWNSISWRDTLSAFAESAGVILVCPDGGPAGSLVDEPLDSGVILASISQARARYAIDSLRIYALGFSVGGEGAYRLALSHPELIRGVIPIGAAVGSSPDWIDNIANAEGRAYCVVHGSMDAPEIRFTPIVALLRGNAAVVRTMLIPETGHTIDFRGRNDTLLQAYRWVDSVNLHALLSSADPPDDYFGGDQFIQDLGVRFVSGELVVDRADIHRVSLYDYLGRCVESVEVDTSASPTPVRLDVASGSVCFVIVEGRAGLRNVYRVQK